MADPSPVPGRAGHGHFRVLLAGDLGSEVSLAWNGHLPAWVMLLEDGDLHVKDDVGAEVVIPSVPKFTELRIGPQAVLAAQTVGLLAVWS